MPARPHQGFSEPAAACGWDPPRIARRTRPPAFSRSSARTARGATQPASSGGSMVCAQLLASRRSTLRRGNATAQRAARQRSRSTTLERIALPSLWDWPMRAGYDRPVLSEAQAQKIRLHLAMFHRPRSRHRPRASADGSLWQNANKTGVRLWTDRSPACGVQVRSIRSIPTRSARFGPPTCFWRVL